MTRDRRQIHRVRKLDRNWSVHTGEQEWERKLPLLLDKIGVWKYEFRENGEWKKHGYYLLKRIICEMNIHVLFGFEGYTHIHIILVTSATHIRKKRVFFCWSRRDSMEYSADKQYTLYINEHFGERHQQQKPIDTRKKKKRNVYRSSYMENVWYCFEGSGKRRCKVYKSK